MNFLIWSGEFRKIAGISPENVQPCFFRVSGAPPTKVTPKIVGIPLQFQIFEPKMFHADFLLTGETNIYIMDL